jgi:hypothetical protein
MTINTKAQEEIYWWQDHLQDWNGKAILLPSPQIILQTDASSLGWGATCNQSLAGGPWSMMEREFGNNRENC